jgi:DNA-binding transcriptional ArsR family regulator
MVKYQDPTLDRTFAALAVPARRQLLARLGARPGLSVSELAEPLPMSLPAVMKHLDVLADAGLITRNKVGRTVECRLSAKPMKRASDWLGDYRCFWEQRLDRLEAYLQSEEKKEKSNERKK